jgi:hypothetical protein
MAIHQPKYIVYYSLVSDVTISHQLHWQLHHQHCSIDNVNPSLRIGRLSIGCCGCLSCVREPKSEFSRNREKGESQMWNAVKNGTRHLK